ncbi:MAG: hypothetical protein ACJ0F6_01770 [Acidimicrobiales bacterium]
MAIRYRTFHFSATDFDEVAMLLRANHHVNEQNFWVHIEPMVEEGGGTPKLNLLAHVF